MGLFQSEKKYHFLNCQMLEPRKRKMGPTILQFICHHYFLRQSKVIYIPSTLNNSNETHTFMCLGRAGRFGQHCSNIQI